jgi:cytoskeleton protein RodZ
MTELPGADAALAATPGATLAAARAATGLSIAEVAEQMRISPRQVEAIESDRYAELPGAVFVRGFVRNYARLLKLDPVPLLHALESELGGEVPLRAHEIAGTLPETVRRSHGRWWLALIAIVVGVAGAAAVYEWWRGRSGADAPAQSSSAPREVPSALRAPTAAGTPSALESIPLAPERVADTPGGGGGEAGSSAGAAAGPREAPTPATAAETAPSKPAPVGTVRVDVVFVADTWIELRDGEGTVQFSGTGVAGSTRSFEAHAPVSMVVGNAQGVRITYNGRPFDVASHATRNIARFTLE